MPSLFYEIFNKKIKLSEKVIKDFLKEVEVLFIQFQQDRDIDNLRVLKNKIEHLLEKKPKKLSKEGRREYKLIDDLLEHINEYIETKEKEEKKPELIDVVKEVEKQYKNCSNIKEENKDKYKSFCIKKSKIDYEKDLITLQLELLKLQKHIKENGEKLLIIFEGRDAAGKGGTIKRFREYLNPRGARVVALEKPNEVERTQWYFQRYINHLPSGGEMVFFDRSWYNRAGVEPVMGFVSKKSYERFLHDVPEFEKMLVKSDTKVIKFYFSVSKEEQAQRFEDRKLNPLKQYKLSPIDQFSQKLWEKYSLAEYHNFSKTHHKDAPWIIINSDDKKKARINAIKYVLNQFNYPDKIDEKKLIIDDKIVMDGKAKAEKLKKEIDIKKDLFE
ncbi:MAG: polyphosphate kinase 2 [Candidatus Gracilibacteria bacterium]|nr:polyphosphate kinase 2 [Candidatus Gracilibacteria bacterium]